MTGKRGLVDIDTVEYTSESTGLKLQNGGKIIVSFRLIHSGMF